MDCSNLLAVDLINPAPRSPRFHANREFVLARGNACVVFSGKHTGAERKPSRMTGSYFFDGFRVVHDSRDTEFSVYALPRRGYLPNPVSRVVFVQQICATSSSEVGHRYFGVCEVRSMASLPPSHCGRVCDAFEMERHDTHPPTQVVSLFYRI